MSATPIRDALLQRIQALPVGVNLTQGQKTQYFERYSNKDEATCDAVQRFKPNNQDLIDDAVGLYPAQGAAPAGESRPFLILFFILYILVAVSPGPLWGFTALSGYSFHSGDPGCRLAASCCDMRLNSSSI